MDDSVPFHRRLDNFFDGKEKEFNFDKIFLTFKLKKEMAFLTKK